ARARSANALAATVIEPDELLLAPQRWAVVEYAAIEKPAIGGAASWTADHQMTVDGLGVWFDTQTACGFGFSNSPHSDRHVYRQAFFPWPCAVTLDAGDDVHVSLRADAVGTDSVFSWATDVTGSRSGRQTHVFRQSTFCGALLSAERLRRRAETYVPDAGPWAPVDRRVLDLMEQRLSIGEIADHVMREFPRLFAGRTQALTRVGD